MPANNFIVYDREPLLEHDENEDDKFDWNKFEGTDRNGNRIYEPVKEKLGQAIESNIIQLHPQFIENKTFTTTPRIFPKERGKAVVAFLLMAFGFTCNSISIVLTHQKVPDRTLHPPLPDISLDNITKRRWLNDVADIIVIFCTLSTAILVLFHRHRWIVCRRVFIILSLLYCMRSVTMFVTVLPLANDHVYCSPKINSTYSIGQTVLVITEEVFKLIGAGGLPITGRKTLCGDYIFSGHTIILMLAYLLIGEYAPKKVKLYTVLHWCSWALAWFGMICLLISHGHYTIDVIIAYYATTRLFWIYHVFANNPEFQKKSSINSLSEVWWFPLFRYFEINISGPIPNEFSIPRIRRRHAFIIRKEFLE